MKKKTQQEMKKKKKEEEVVKMDTLEKEVKKELKGRSEKGDNLFKKYGEQREYSFKEEVVDSARVQEKEKEEKTIVVLYCIVLWNTTRRIENEFTGTVARNFILFVSLTFEVYCAHHYCRRSALKLYSSRA